MALSLLLLGFLMKGCTPAAQSDLTLPEMGEVQYLVDIDSVAFEWKSFAERPEVSGYNIYRKTLAEQGYTLIDSLNSRFTTHYVDSPLAPSTTYLYRFATKNANGAAGVATQPLQITTRAFAPPTHVQAVGNYPRKVKILWRPHKDLRTQGYIIQRAEGKDFVEVARIANRLQVEYLDTNLKDSTEYFYRVFAFTASDIRSAPSPVVSARTKPIPAMPQGVFASFDLPKMVTIRWQKSPQSDIASYEVSRTILGGISSEVLANVAATETSYTDKSEIDGVRYGYYVVAIDKDGLRSERQKSPIEGGTLAAPAAPTIQSIGTEKGSVILRWTGDSRSVQYTINKQQSSFFGKKERYISIPYTYFYDHEVAPGEQYLYNVIAIDKFGLQSSPSETVSVTLEGR